MIITETSPPKPSEELSAPEKDKPDSLLVDTTMKEVAHNYDNEDDDVPLERVFRKCKILLSDSDDDENEPTETASVSSLTDEDKSVVLTVFEDKILRGNF